MYQTQLINLKSNKKKTYFAPEWNHYIFEGIVNDIDFSIISKLILDNESKIKEEHQHSGYDGNTGLGDSLTSRFGFYNVLDWSNDEIYKLKQLIKIFHAKFLNELKLKVQSEMFIQCWANVMRKGEQIKPHIHGTSEETYLGGHICVQCDDTSTHYINPVNQINNPEIYSSKNEVGKITLFENCLPHYTDIHNGDSERITIAFDLNPFIPEKIKNNKFVRLY